tara:strand:- start:38 stop:1081 length:1044 start_codon:yes stop_codon:yes gene_type:complete
MAYTDIDNPELFFQTKLYAGNSTARSITFDGSKNMQPDWVWIKERDDAINHYGYDSVRGTDKRLQQNINNAEDTTDTTWFRSFDTNGFTIGTEDNINDTGDNYVAWCWKAGGSASSNSDGSTTSSVSANTTAGFSIVSWTGTGSATTVGHGLGAVPKWIIVKNRDTARNWNVYYGDETDYLQLNDSGATIDNDNKWNDTAPTSSVFTVNTSSDTNKSGDAMIAYCFTNIKGYSKLGSYTANGNANGTFIYTGFRPAYVMIKRTDSAQQWGIVDSKRDVDNPAQFHLFAESSQAEGGASSYNNFDLLSNGIKMRSNDQWTNASGGTYVYMAFAESPFVNSNGIPNNAR